MHEAPASRVVMISGANRGIGKILSEQLRQTGWRVSAGVRDIASLPPGPGLFVHEFDAKRHQEKDWVDATLAHYGRIDALIANAGVMIPASIVDISEDDMDTMLTVNLRSPIRLVQAAWPFLKACKRGRVIILASLSGKRVKSALSGPYAITKHAAVALAHSIKKTGWADGIRATAVCPGFVATDMARSITSKDDAEMTQPDDIARMILAVLDLPNTANVAELSISCSEEDLY
ncbi:SDR family NAD(P)-dependent oxidoreductase [Gluconobacter albidus]|uniref:Short-chain dehydrogenase n=1 Tax=Gluconobacter albidus TaxID=318683 RepID=A0AAW3QTN5_9PROT|nr:SDR family NAD(P)-dependent oxidoreductase [Gluconobacter albidus]KXV36969.1 short-chain dehydrogenase [Gluconobacter albidus]MCP1274328.1 SDR family NAD(P)-dependent oxidoreductase [Gluconobacter albidus]GBQ82716.1 dehydrogenase [Gluconobacter albidus NBRC 3250]GLQ69816.1 short-chain dehydrogenase [Gluconobacter albidus]